MGAIRLDDPASLTLEESAAASTPAAGYVVIYAKSDGQLYFKDDAGTEGRLGGGLARGTPVATTSGTTVTVATGIAAGVSVVELSLSAISTNGSSAILVQIGDSGGFETTGYASSAWQGGSSDTLLTSTAGFLCNTGSNSSLNVSGVVLLRRGTGNLWTFGGTTARSDGAGYCLGGTKTLSDELTQIRITMVNGTDTYDAGEITPFY